MCIRVLDLAVIAAAAARVAGAGAVLPQVEDVESKLPPKVPVIVKVAMSSYQSTIYNWIKASGACACGALGGLAP